MILEKDWEIRKEMLDNCLTNIQEEIKQAQGDESLDSVFIKNYIAGLCMASIIILKERQLLVGELIGVVEEQPKTSVELKKDCFVEAKKYEDLRRKFCKARKLLHEFCDLIVELGNAAIDEEVTGNRKEYEKVEMSLAEWGDWVQDQLWRWEKKK